MTIARIIAEWLYPVVFKSEVLLTKNLDSCNGKLEEACRQRDTLKNLTATQERTITSLSGSLADSRNDYHKLKNSTDTVIQAQRNRIQLLEKELESRGKMLDSVIPVTTKSKRVSAK